MKIAIGSDHGGFHLKKAIIKYLFEKGHTIQDFGTDSTKSVDYPDIAAPVARSVASGVNEFGILICGTGIGMSITANKIKGVRAAVCTDYYSTKYTRLHNDSNILCIGERVLGYGVAMELVKTFLETEYEGGRHQARIDKISALETEE